MRSNTNQTWIGDHDNNIKEAFRQFLIVLFMMLSLIEVSANAETGTWSSVGSMATARSYHTATLLQNGKVLVVGGGDFRSPLASAELYDPMTKTWSNAGSMATARIKYTVTPLQNGKILFVGGGIVLDKSGGRIIPVNNTDIYDPVANTWSSGGDMLTAHYSHTATLLSNGKVLVAGQEGAELYDPVTNTWSRTGSMVNGGSGHTAILLPNGKVLVTGGGFGDSELYNPDVNTWSSAGSMITTHGKPNVILLQNGNVLVAGGISNLIANAELYDSVNNTWGNAGSMATGRNNTTATLLSTGKILVIGDIPSGGELYDPTTNTWSSADSMVMEGRSKYTISSTLNGNVLITGGWYVSRLTAGAELYDSATNTWSSAGNMSIARRGFTATTLQNGNVLVAGGIDNDGSLQTSAEIYSPMTTTEACLFSWAEATYPDYLSPSGASSSTQTPYTYRYYTNTNSYLGISSADNHLYYLNSNNILTDLGDLTIWMGRAGCQ